MDISSLPYKQVKLRFLPNGIPVPYTDMRKRLNGLVDIIQYSFTLLYSNFLPNKLYGKKSEKTSAL